LLTSSLAALKHESLSRFGGFFSSARLNGLPGGLESLFTIFFVSVLNEGNCVSSEKLENPSNVFCLLVGYSILGEDGQVKSSLENIIMLDFSFRFLLRCRVRKTLVSSKKHMAQIHCIPSTLADNRLAIIK